MWWGGRGEEEEEGRRGGGDKGREEEKRKEREKRGRRLSTTLTISSGENPATSCQISLWNLAAYNYKELWCDSDHPTVPGST